MEMDQAGHEIQPGKIVTNFGQKLAKFWISMISFYQIRKFRFLSENFDTFFINFAIFAYPG